ncbi:hypothetical protein EYF80_047549 [Liparis tanakae]|uniref:Uncharacterized protein n=1 Tax=Liparis tanakae TaxID=230148 RepID=A0A4Z2FM24_9TELE|nr:hypothetical protein EYF80_047549 [Liparis tanakae]
MLNKALTPRSFQSGKSSFRALGSRQAPDRTNGGRKAGGAPAYDHHVGLVGKPLHFDPWRRGGMLPLGRLQCPDAPVGCGGEKIHSQDQLRLTGILAIVPVAAGGSPAARPGLFSCSGHISCQLRERNSRADWPELRDDRLKVEIFQLGAKIVLLNSVGHTRLTSTVPGISTCSSDRILRMKMGIQQRESVMTIEKNLLAMREADAVGPVEVAKQPLAGQRQKGDDEAEHPNPEKDGDGSSPPGRQVLERVDDADVLLQSEVGEEEDGHLGGQHGQRADDLALTAVHPGLSVPVVLAAELQVVRPDHEEVDAHQPVCTCEEGAPSFATNSEDLGQEVWFIRPWEDAFRCGNYGRFKVPPHPEMREYLQQREMMHMAWSLFSDRMYERMQMTKMLPKQVVAETTHTKTLSTMLASRSSKDEMPSVLGLQLRT